MAWFKEDKYLNKSNGNAYDTDHPPGAVPPLSGIYKCIGCGHEVVAEHGRQFPPQNHPQHSILSGPIRWKLIVWADHEAKLL
jgi:hypothetical protein